MPFRPKLDQLRVIVAVADAGTFSAAARQLGRVQPAVTQSVRALEAGTQINIFDRTGKTVVMTEAGRLMVQKSREALAAIDSLCDEARRLSSDIESELTVAIDGGVPRDVVTRALEKLSVTYPDLRVAVFAEGFGGAEQLLRDGLVQIAIYFVSAEGTRAGLVRDPVATLSLVPVVASQHPLANEKGPLTRLVLDRYTQLLLSDRARQIAPVQGTIMSSRTWAFSEYASRLSCIRAGLGWGHVLEILVDDDLRSGKLKVLEIGGEFRTAQLCAYHRLGHPPAKAGSLFVDALKRGLSVRRVQRS